MSSMRRRFHKGRIQYRTRTRNGLGATHSASRQAAIPLRLGRHGETLLARFAVSGYAVSLTNVGPALLKGWSGTWAR